MALAASAAPASAETDWSRLQAQAEALRDQALAGSGAYEVIESLTTEVGPRLAGTAAGKRAADWAAAKFKAMGFDEVKVDTFPITAWVRGAESAEVVGPYPQTLAIAGLGGSAPTPPGGIEAEIAVFPTLEALVQAPAGSLKGKIAVVVQAMARMQDGSGYGAVTPIRRIGPSEAAKKGAVAYLVRSLSTTNARLPHTGALNYAADAPRIPAAALAPPDAELLANMARRGRPVTVRLKLDSRTIENAPAYTVVADIKGRERPDEVVLIGAHLDSWDLGTGAVDDGIGVGVVTSAGRLIGKLPQRPRRTLRVALFGAEEMGWSGAAFAKMRAGEVSRYVAASEADFGTGQVLTVQLPAGGFGSPLARAFSAATAPLRLIMSREPSVTAGDDIAPLRGIVPQFALRQEGADYFDLHHSADDTLDKVRPADIDKATAAWAAMAYLIADSDVDFRKAQTPSGP